MQARSIKSFARSASLLALLALGVRADDPPAIACGSSMSMPAPLRSTALAFLSGWGSATSRTIGSAVSSLQLNACNRSSSSSSAA